MPHPSVGQKQIIIVDDEATLTYFLKQSLQEMTIVSNVEVAASGEDALAKLTYGHYDLMITDLKMPGISGFTLIEAARSVRPDLKVILMTAHGTAETSVKTREMRIDGYLTKPFPTMQLCDLSHQILTTQDNTETTAAG